MASMSGLRWVRIVVCALAAMVCAYIAVFGIVMVYAVMLGFEAMGQPDQAQINAFAGKWAPILGPIAGFVFAFLFGLLAARTPHNRFMHGLMTGVLFGGVSLVLGLLGDISVGTFLSPLLLVLGGAAAGKLAARKETPETTTTLEG
ncbi:MAG: hypothetical protein AAF405_08460 [Pseudomonadota bacterium]